MTSSPRLNLSFVMPAQAQKHVTVNEGLERLDAIVQACAVSRTTVQQPQDPQFGDSYILPDGASGPDWDGEPEGAFLTFTDAGWSASHTLTGLRVWVKDIPALWVFDGANWTPAGGPDLDALDRLGINAGADSVNRLVVKSDAELLTHDDVTPGSGDARKVINRAGPGNTASVVFQNNYSGRAEFGLIGDDDFALKTSPDGSAFSPSMILSAGRNKAEINHPLDVLGSPVMTADDKPLLVANLRSSSYDYIDNEVVQLDEAIDSHNGFDPVNSTYTIPHTGFYFVQIGMVTRSVSGDVSTVQVRLYKNLTVRQSVTARNTEINTTRLNDASLISFSQGDIVTIRAQINDPDGTVRFFSGTRITLFRVV